VTTARVRSQYHHGDLERALILTARKLVKRYGVEHLSLRQVAQEIGVSPSAAYHYFPDRDSLLAALGESLFDELADYQDQELTKVQGSGIRAAKERFRTLGRTYFEWARREPHFFELMFSELCNTEAAKKRGKSKEETRAFGNLSKCLDELLEVGALDPKMRPYGELLAWSIVHGATSLISVGHIDPEFFDEVMDGLEISLGIRK
jgi:AcrR family transcriptional regulator